MKTYSDAELKKYNVANLNKIANEELGLALEADLTKSQLRTAILQHQKLHEEATQGETGSEGIAPQATSSETPTAAEKLAKDESAPGVSIKGVEATELRTLKAGDLFVYKANKKEPYKVLSVVDSPTAFGGKQVNIVNTVTGKVWECKGERDLVTYKVYPTTAAADVLQAAANAPEATTEAPEAATELQGIE